VTTSALIAERFLKARKAAAGLEDYPGAMPASLDDAYAVQDAAIRSWNRPVIGWKVGRIIEPDRFGADRLAGPIFHCEAADADGNGPDMPVFGRGFAAGEAEFLLRIGREPPPGKMDYSLADAAELIDAVHVGIEIASSPLANINALGPVAIISDFGNNNGLLVGKAIDDWRSSGFEAWTVTSFVDGREVGSGSASAFSSGALGSAAFLFGLMAKRGIPLQAGQWISSGAVTGIHDAAPGQRFEARFGSGLKVGCRLAAESPRDIE
jgi:2-keto-4-pentenoate hydratase